MEAGKLDTSIVIEQKSVVRDALGGETVTWSTYKTVWAAVRYVRNLENVKADQVTAARIVEFSIRYLDAPNVDEAMRVSYNSGYYQIEGIQFLGRQETIKLITKLNV